jgi:glutathione-regulated potassium-efflux system ancillary protein KefG
MKILILFAHPAFEKSRVNKHMLKGIENINNVTLHDLYESYPEFDIDIKKEQALLEEHDCIVLQFPFFWYSTPAILKEWQDLVLEHGWAFGSKGNALKDKLFLNMISTGGPQSAYTKEGYQHYTLFELVAPIRQTAQLCKMIPIAPFAVHGTHAISNEDLDEKRNQYHMLLTLISEDKFNLEEALQLQYLNDYII